MLRVVATRAGPVPLVHATNMITQRNNRIGELVPDISSNTKPAIMETGTNAVAVV
jgi:hypothetical protein